MATRIPPGRRFTIIDRAIKYRLSSRRHPWG